MKLCRDVGHDNGKPEKCSGTQACVKIQHSTSMYHNRWIMNIILILGSSSLLERCWLPIRKTPSKYIIFNVRFIFSFSFFGKLVN